ncbi:hypothetical protein CIPAW_07G059300 [Carya illinoinensis]|uniref:Uncharacterized protein n=1 Tax=Carya illinoinensis TaxID=32201 RepID=A0A8T1PZB6_CARIL|nr:hypothetical protein CIPAW_07G059300 [Carya illinoinensis]
MENTDTEQETESSLRGVFKLLGEPTIVINGLSISINGGSTKL